MDSPEGWHAGTAVLLRRSSAGRSSGLMPLIRQHCRNSEELSEGAEVGGQMHARAQRAHGNAPPGPPGSSLAASMKSEFDLPFTPAPKRESDPGHLKSPPELICVARHARRSLTEFQDGEDIDHGFRHEAAEFHKLRDFRSVGGTL